MFSRNINAALCLHLIESNIYMQSEKQKEHEAVLNIFLHFISKHGNNKGMLLLQLFENSVLSIFTRTSFALHPATS